MITITGGKGGEYELLEEPTYTQNLFHMLLVGSVTSLHMQWDVSWTISKQAFTKIV